MNSLFKTKEKEHSKRNIMDFEKLLRHIGYGIKDSTIAGFPTRATFIDLINKRGQHVTFQHWVRPASHISIAGALSDYPRPNIPQTLRSLHPVNTWIQETLNLYKQHHIYFIVILPQTKGGKMVYTFWVGEYIDIDRKHWVLNPSGAQANRLMLKVALGAVNYDFVGLKELKQKLDKIFKNEN